MKIDLTTPALALAHLRSLPPTLPVELPGAGDPNPHCTAVDALEAITGLPANNWAAGKNRWEWTAGELVSELVSELNGVSIHANDHGTTYYSTTDEDGETVYSFTLDFEDTWDQAAEDAIDSGSTPSKY